MSNGHLLFGGFYETHGYLSDVWQFAWTIVGGGKWTLMLPSGTSPLGRLGHASTVVEDEMIIHGGKGIGGSRLATFNDTWRYNPLSRTWNELIYSTRHEVNPVGRRGHILEYIPVLNALYIFGGMTGREDNRNGCVTTLGDFWSLNLANWPGKLCKPPQRAPRRDTMVQVLYPTSEA